MCEHDDESDENLRGINHAIARSRPGKPAIPGEDFCAWIQSPHLEVRMKAFSLLAERRNEILDLTVDELDALVDRYFDNAIGQLTREADDYSRFALAGELGLLFVRTWWDHRKLDSSLHRYKAVMERLILRNDPGLTDALILRVLEHIFQDYKTREFFRDWTRRPMLRDAFETAYDLAKKWQS